MSMKNMREIEKIYSADVINYFGENLRVYRDSFGDLVIDVFSLAPFFRFTLASAQITYYNLANTFPKEILILNFRWGIIECDKYGLVASYSMTYEGFKIFAPHVTSNNFAFITILHMFDDEERKTNPSFKRDHTKEVEEFAAIAKKYEIEDET